jgi:exodeoxyribonuclease VII large subunit
MQDRESQLARLAGKIESLSPLAVLARGYSITQNAATRSVVRTAEDLTIGETILTRFARGEAVSTVQRINRKTS